MQNMTVSRHARRGILKPVSNQEEKLWTEPWRKRFNLTDIAAERPILQLSGGNEQKALMSRAMIDDADIIVLNDPTRGVDIGVKREFYHVLLDVAAAGKLIVWYSSEDAEFLECSRVLIFRRGLIATEISGQDASRENLSAAFFGTSETQELPRKRPRRSGPAKNFAGLAGATCRLVSDAHRDRPLQSESPFPVRAWTLIGNGSPFGSRVLWPDVCCRT